MNFTALEENNFVFTTKPDFITFIDDNGELKKARENYAVKRGETKKNKKHKLCLIFTGKISNLTVLDIDSKEIYNKLVEQYKGLKNVYTVETLNGYHLYFDYDPDIKGTLQNVFTKYKELGKVDIRNDNDVITAQGSTYELLDGKGSTFTYKYLYGEMGYEFPEEIKNMMKLKCFNSYEEEKKEEEKEEKEEKKYSKLTDEEITKIIDMIDDDKADDFELWRNAGFALFNELGKDGRSYFHQFSKKSDKYNKKEVDKQYDTFKPTKQSNIYSFGTLRAWAKEADPEGYKSLFNKKPKANNSQFWEMMKLFNNSDIANYYKEIAPQRFIYSKNIWYGYNEHNVITELSDKTPSQLISNISDILKAKLKEEIQKIEPDDKTYDETYKLFKSCYKSVGTASFVRGMLEYIPTFYNDDTLREKLDNNPFLLAFNDMVYDFKIKQARKIEMKDYISITTGYKYPTTSDAKKQQEIKDLIFSVFENVKMAKYWLESVAMSIHTNKFEKFYIHSGSGRNGKGLLFSLVESALGKYIATADSEFLTSRIESGKPNPVLTKARGKRFLMITEPSSEDNNKEIKLNVDLIKKLSGLDKIEARDLFQKSKDVIEYKPQFTCFLQCNQKPELGKIDNGIKQRIQIIEYPFTFVEEPYSKHERKKNMDLKDKLLNQDYINEMIILLITTVCKFTEFDIPEDILEANTEYINSCDPVREWFFDNFVIVNDDKYKIRSSEMLTKFKLATGKQMIQAKFNNYMKAYNIVYKISGGVNYFYGVMAKQIVEEATPNDLDQ
jgi:phage/plasmid-associated DNA primase